MTEFKYFSREDFACQCGCGRNEIPDGFIQDCDRLRAMCGFPLIVNSGWRCENHPIEAAKERPGEHNKAAADFEVSGGYQRFMVVAMAADLGFNGVGVARGFVHVDDRDVPPVMWVYD